jgi:1,4-dihydroxy-2-naphthoyl-CoA synthase
MAIKMLKFAMNLTDDGMVGQGLLVKPPISVYDGRSQKVEMHSLKEINFEKNGLP